jgi:2-oxoisovalerate dehydrogenase E1 component beta subunit
MLYLGRDPQPGWDYPERHESGYADPEAWSYWAARDPIACYARSLEQEGLLGRDELEALRRKAHERVESEARRVIQAPWPAADTVGSRVVADGPAPCRVDPLVRDADPPRTLPPLEVFQADPAGRTFLEAITLGVGDALRADERCFVLGEDVGGRYGNAFLLLRPLLEEHGERILNAPLAEGAILGASIGAALAGLRPIAEMQFNDFVATGFNQLVNNAAKLRYRTGLGVPMVVRMPWGGLRHAGPYHSQNTEPWFYRTPGLKIVVPATPADARALLAAAVADPDPVLFYEHIALYRDPRVRQALPDTPPEPLALGRAALRREGGQLALVSYGAYVHVALRAAERLAAEGLEASVLDLRTLAPLDHEALLAVARHTGKVLIVHEDTRRGGVGESLAAIVQEQAFAHLDAPVRIVAALDTPVPYSPPLEKAFLPGEEEVLAAARALARW